MQTKHYVSIKAAPLVSIITLNWNQTDATCAFLESTRSITYKNLEILVYDMGSSSDPAPRIYAGNYANARLIKADLQSCAYNVTSIQWAIQQAKGDFILFVNNHCVLSESIVDDLLAPFLTDNRLAVTCPKVKSYHQPDLIEYAGNSGVNIFTGRHHIRGRRKTDRGQFDKGVYTQGAYSGVMMIRKNIAANTDILPPNFFVYFDDADLSARILKKGYKIFYQPKAVVFNKSVISDSGETPMQVYYSTRNRITYMRQNTSLLQFSIFTAMFTLASIPAHSVKFLVRRQFTHLKLFYRAIGWHLRRRPVVYG